jgi:hypothetical protein
MPSQNVANLAIHAGCMPYSLCDWATVIINSLNSRKFGNNINGLQREEADWFSIKFHKITT